MSFSMPPMLMKVCLRTSVTWRGGRLSQPCCALLTTANSAMRKSPSLLQKSSNDIERDAERCAAALLMPRKKLSLSAERVYADFIHRHGARKTDGRLRQPVEGGPGCLLPSLP